MPSNFNKRGLNHKLLKAKDPVVYRKTFQKCGTSWIRTVIAVVKIIGTIGTVTLDLPGHMLTPSLAMNPAFLRSKYVLNNTQFNGFIGINCANLIDDFHGSNKW